MKLQSAALALAVLFVVGTICVGAAKAQSNSAISGKIIDEKTHHPIGAVKVEVFADEESNNPKLLGSTLSAHDGTFRVGGLSGGQYRVELTKSGYAVQILTGLAVRPNEHTIIGVPVAMARASSEYALKMACNSLVRQEEVADVYVVCGGK